MRLFFSSAWLLFLGLFLQVHAEEKRTKLSVDQVEWDNSFLIQLNPLVDDQSLFEHITSGPNSKVFEFNVSVSAWIAWNDSNVLYSIENGGSQKFSAKKPFHLRLHFTDLDISSRGSRFNADLKLNISVEGGETFYFNFTRLFVAQDGFGSGEKQAEDFIVVPLVLSTRGSGSIADLISGLFAEYELGFPLDSFMSYIEMVYPSTIVGLRSGKEIKESAIIMYILAGLLSLPIFYTIFRYIFFAVSTAIERRKISKQ